MEGRCGIKGTPVHFMRWTFCLLSDLAAIRSGNNSLGMDLSNCKSLLLLRDTGYPWMTRSLIAPTAQCTEQIALICLGKGEEVVWEFGKKSRHNFQPATPVTNSHRISWPCVQGRVLAGDVVRSLQGHLLFGCGCLHPTCPIPAVGSRHPWLPTWLRWQTSPCRPAP